MLFKKIESEQSGRLDILVNNAYKGVNVKHIHVFDIEKILSFRQNYLNY